MPKQKPRVTAKRGPQPDPLRHVAGAVIADAFLDRLDALLLEFDAHMELTSSPSRAAVMFKFRAAPDLALRMLVREEHGTTAYLSYEESGDVDPPDPTKIIDAKEKP